MTFRVISLFDGAFEMELSLFPQISANPEKAATLMGLQNLPERINVPVWAFAIVTPDEVVLVDAGGGSLMGKGFGGVSSALNAAGIEPAQIHRVFLTHLHGDHCGGLLDAEGNAAFVNARIALSRAELNFWTGSAVPESAAAIADDAIRVLGAYENRVDVVEPGDRLDGAEAIAAPGHTPGHVGWAFADAGVIAAGDIVHNGSLQFAQQDWGSDWDMDPVAATASREHLIALAKSAGMDLLCAHYGRSGPYG